MPVCSVHSFSFPFTFNQKLKWRWYWRKKEVPPPSPPPFSHNPPGHNCGLPCCNQTAEVEIKPVSNQRGCVVVPIFAPTELSESNFVMKKAHRPSSLPPFGNPPTTPRHRSEDSFSSFYESTTSAAANNKPKLNTSPNDVIEDDDDVSDGEYDEDTLGRRLIKLEHRSDVIAPEPSAELLVMHGLEVVGESATILRRRNKPLAQWEQVKHRHFTLPDSPQTPHRIMFLNHQPGESTDYYYGTLQDRDSGFMSPGQTNTLKSELMNTLKKYETIADEQEKLLLNPEASITNSPASNSNSTNTNMDIASPTNTLNSNSDSVDYRKDLSDSKSVLSDGSVSMFSRDGTGQDRRGSKARILDTSLPPVPKEEPSVLRDSFRSSSKDVALIEEDNESLVDDSDHIYDVVNDVKAASEKLAAQAQVRAQQKIEDEKPGTKKDVNVKEEEKEAKQSGVEKDDEFEIGIENENNKTSMTRVRSSVADLLSPSADSDFESGSLNYNASVSDCNTESYIYNGSLLSQKNNNTYNDSASHNKDNIYYQGSLLRHRFVAEKSNKPIIFMMGGKPIVLNNSATNDASSDSHQYYNGSQQSEISGSSSEQRIVPKIQLDYSIKRRLSLIDSHGEDFINSPSSTTKNRNRNLPPTVHIDSVSGGGLYSGALALSGLNIESTTKLKLWDLRLITINREENNYSTYPPRRSVSEDLCIGSFSRTPELGFRHRHNSDVSTDQYVGQKIHRILRSPVLTRSTGVANFVTAGDNFDSVAAIAKQDLALKTLDKIDGAWETGKHLLSGLNLSPLDVLKDTESERLKWGRLSLYPSALDVDEESLLYESPSFCGIYRLSQQYRSEGSEGLTGSSVEGGNNSVLSSQVGGGSGVGKNKDGGVGGGGSSKGGGGGSSNNKGGGSGNRGGVDDGSGSSIYGGSIYGSTFGWKGVGEYNNGSSSSRKGSVSSVHSRRSNNIYNKKKRDRSKDPDRPVVWGDASFVDWRRQANLFKDRQFITMIL